MTKPRVGYLCKSCGGAAPMGIGYTTPADGAYEASLKARQCPCGYSVAPVPDPDTTVRGTL